MMKFEKSPPELEQMFADAFPTDPRAERKKMFGYPAGFVNGNMFGGLWQASMVLRLSDADRAALSAQGGQPFEPMGRTMKGYITVPKPMLADQAQLRGWLQRAFEFGMSLPAKQPKPKKEAKKKK